MRAILVRSPVRDHLVAAEMITTKAAKRRMKRREQANIRMGKLRAAFQFAKELVGIQTPKKTVLCSLMASNGLDLAQAKEMYKVAKKKPRKRHLSRKARE